MKEMYFEKTNGFNAILFTDGLNWFSFVTEFESADEVETAIKNGDLYCLHDLLDEVGYYYNDDYDNDDFADQTDAFNEWLIEGYKRFKIEDISNNCNCIKDPYTGAIIPREHDEVTFELIETED